MTRSSVVRESAAVTVVLDVRYPQSYLALGPTLRFAESMGIDVDWLPLSVATLKPPTEANQADDRSILHRRHRAHAIAREIQTYAQAQGLVLEEIYRDTPADALMQAWLYVRDRNAKSLPRFLEDCFAAYWSLELDAGDLPAVAGRVESAIGGGAGFVEWAASEGEAAVARVVEDLNERGVFAVPTYLVEGEVFLGRQHLPMIRWILEGRSGSVPI